MHTVLHTGKQKIVGLEMINLNNNSDYIQIWSDEKCEVVIIDT